MMGMDGGLKLEGTRGNICLKLFVFAHSRKMAVFPFPRYVVEVFQLVSE